MTLRSRLQKVTSLMRPEQSGAQPLTVVLNEADPDRPPGQYRRTNAAGLPVVEIVFDPAAGPVELPAPPYKLVQSVDPVDLA
jgi:hypothetical protein